MIKEFLNYLRYEKRYSTLTVETYSRVLHAFESYLPFEVSVEKVNRKHVRGFIVYLVESKKYKQKTVNLYIATLKSFYKYLHRQSRIQEKPMEYVRYLKVGRILPKVIRKEKINFLLDNLEFPSGYIGFRDKLILEVLYGAGLRVCEILTLKDLNYNPFDSYLKVLGKGKKERVLPLYPELSSMISDFLILKRGLYPDCDHLFLNNRGRPYSPETLSSLVKKYLNLIVLDEKKSPIVMRHSFATHLMDAGAETKAIQDLLGHESIRTTQAYTHVSIEFKRYSFIKAHPKA